MVELSDQQLNRAERSYEAVWRGWAEVIGGEMLMYSRTKDSVSASMRSYAFLFDEFAWGQTIFAPLKCKLVRVLWELTGSKVANGGSRLTPTSPPILSPSQPLPSLLPHHLKVCSSCQLSVLPCCSIPTEYSRALTCHHFIALLYWTSPYTTLLHYKLILMTCKPVRSQTEREMGKKREKEKHRRVWWGWEGLSLQYILLFPPSHIPMRTGGCM